MIERLLTERLPSFLGAEGRAEDEVVQHVRGMVAPGAALRRGTELAPGGMSEDECIQLGADDSVLHTLGQVAEVSVIAGTRVWSMGS